MFGGVLAGLALVVLGDAPAASWHELARGDDVTVSVRERAGSTLPEIRAVTRIDATPWEVLAVIRDVGNHPAWLTDCAEARVLREESETVWIVYQRTRLPWPVSDRDSVSSTELAIAGDGELFVSWHAIAEPQWSEREGIVRMRTLEGSYRLRAGAAGRTEVEYRLFLDPEGVVPAWLARRFLVDVPLETLRQLRARVPGARSRYEAWLREHDPAWRGRAGR